MLAMDTYVNCYDWGLVQKDQKDAIRSKALDLILQIP